MPYLIITCIGIMFALSFQEPEWTEVYPQIELKQVEYRSESNVSLPSPPHSPSVSGGLKSGTGELDL